MRVLIQTLTRALILLFTLGLPVFAQSTQPAKEATGTITGQIKMGDQPARNVVVALVPGDYGTSPNSATTKATTDEAGRYVLTGVAAGRFRVTPLAPAYIVYNGTLARTDAQTVTPGEGEKIDGVDFNLVRGGVITGRVTSAEGRVVIGERVNVTSVDATTQRGQTNRPAPATDVNFTTDDRGVYRVYGLVAGRYTISVGSGRGANGGQNGGPGGGGAGGGFGGFGAFGMSSNGYQLTYYPDTVEQAQAQSVEVEAGRETSGINIRMAARGETFAASGQVIDADTGKPAVGVLIGHGNTSGNGNRRFVAGDTTDGVTSETGAFRIEGLKPGTYAAFVAQDPAAGPTEVYSDPATFEILAQEVTGLQVMMHHAASINGTVMFEGAPDPSLAGNLQNLVIDASVRSTGLNVASDQAASVSPNGSFRITGLPPGRVSLSVTNAQSPGPFSGITLLRVERNGADVRSGMQVVSGEEVTGVRIVLASGNSVVRGTVKFEGGTLTQGMMVIAMARRTDEGGVAGGGRGGMASAPSQVDANGRFQLEKLVAGTYEISVQMAGGGGGGGRNPRQQGPTPVTQTIIVGNGTVHDVTMTLNLAPQPTPTDGATGNPTQGRGRIRP